MPLVFTCVGEGDDVFFPPAGSAVTDLVGGHEKKHRGVEAPAHLLLSSPLLHQPHFFQVKPFSGVDLFIVVGVKLI